jgi:hypothetical protein
MTRSNSIPAERGGARPRRSSAGVFEVGDGVEEGCRRQEMATAAMGGDMHGTEGFNSGHCSFARLLSPTWQLTQN